MSLVRRSGSKTLRVTAYNVPGEDEYRARLKKMDEDLDEEKRRRGWKDPEIHRDSERENAAADTVLAGYRMFLVFCTAKVPREVSRLD